LEASRAAIQTARVLQPEPCCRLGERDARLPADECEEIVSPAALRTPLELSVARRGSAPFRAIGRSGTETGRFAEAELNESGRLGDHSSTAIREQERGERDGRALVLLRSESRDRLF
jgi:hypothetical protein